MISENHFTTNNEEHTQNSMSMVLMKDDKLNNTGQWGAQEIEAI
jgi:hypothetical protein